MPGSGGDGRTVLTRATRHLSGQWLEKGENKSALPELWSEANKHT